MVPKRKAKEIKINTTSNHVGFETLRKKPSCYLKQVYRMWDICSVRGAAL